MVDPQSLHESVAHPPHDFAVRFVEYPRHLDPNAGEAVHREEPAIVQFGVGPPPVHELIVLAPMHLGRAGTVVGGAGGYGKAVLKVVQSTVDEFQPVELVAVALTVAEHGDANFSLPEFPVDIECLGIA